jgi:hypothetical protein
MGCDAAEVRDIQPTLDMENRHFGALSGLSLTVDTIDNSDAASTF